MPNPTSVNQAQALALAKASGANPVQLAQVSSQFKSTPPVDTSSTNNSSTVGGAVDANGNIISPNTPQPSGQTSTSTTTVPQGYSGISPISTYAVRQGDSAASIASNMGTTVAALEAANPYTDFANLNPGQAIKNPSASSSSSTDWNAVHATVSATGDAPASGGDARDAIGTALNSQPATNTTTNVVNDVWGQTVNDLNNLTSYESSMESVQAYQNEFSTALGIPQAQAQLLNIQTIMNGTEDDIRNEVNATGGFATESQVEALTTTRNNVLVKQATNIQNGLSIAQTNLTNAVSAYGADQSNAVAAFKDKISNDSTVLGYYQNLQTQSTSNYQKIVTASGYKGLVTALGSNPQLISQAETALGLQPGTLSNPQTVANLDAYSYKVQTMAITAAADAARSGYYDSRTIQSQVQSATSLIDQYTSLPTFQYYSQAVPILSKIQAAMSNPGSVSDNTLLDGVVQIDTGGNAVTDAQVSTITGGRSVTDTIQVMQQKLDNGGVLSADQRQQLLGIAQAVVGNYSTGYQALQTQLQTAFSNSGIDPAFQAMIPNLDELNSAQAYSTVSTANNPAPNGQNYQVGTTFTSGDTTLTYKGNGTFTDTTGATYTMDANGNLSPLKTK